MGVSQERETQQESYTHTHTHIRAHTRIHTQGRGALKTLVLAAGKFLHFLGTACCPRDGLAMAGKELVKRSPEK